MDQLLGTTFVPVNIADIARMYTVPMRFVPVSALLSIRLPDLSNNRYPLVHAFRLCWNLKSFVVKGSPVSPSAVYVLTHGSLGSDRPPEEPSKLR
eukprot:1191476-Prorocentrum_minimum.AAC.3